MTISDRIKKIRMSNNEMTMEVFGKRIGVVKATVSNWENGANVPNNMIKAICREFGISEHWLRTGEGEMKIEDCKDNRYFSNIGKLQRMDDETIMRWVNAIAETDPSVLKHIEEFMKLLLNIPND